MEKKRALKNHLRLYLYHQILTPTPKIFNIREKYNFTQQNKNLFNRSTKDIILEDGWLLK